MIGISVGQTFKNKYHDHSYIECRLVNINDTVRYEHVWNKIIHIKIIDMYLIVSNLYLYPEDADENREFGFFATVRRSQSNWQTEI